eukprot:754113-Hanusia_phi.AAC.2
MAPHPVATDAESMKLLSFPPAHLPRGQGKQPIPCWVTTESLRKRLVGSTELPASQQSPARLHQGSPPSAVDTHVSCEDAVGKDSKSLRAFRAAGMKVLAAIQQHLPSSH